MCEVGPGTNGCNIPIYTPAESDCQNKCYQNYSKNISEYLKCFAGCGSASTNVITQNPDKIIPTFLEEVLTYINSKFNIFDITAIKSIVQSLKSGNFTSSVNKINANQTIITLNIPYKNIVLYIIYDSLTNTYFFEIPSQLNLDGSKEQASIAYIVGTDGSINGKILVNGQEFPFLTYSVTANPNIVKNQACYDCLNNLAITKNYSCAKECGTTNNNNNNSIFNTFFNGTTIPSQSQNKTATPNDNYNPITYR
jgi:hypothetical protein